MAKQLNVNLAFTANTDQAKAQLKDLQQQLSSVISSATLKPEGLGIDKELMKSVQTADQLKSILKESTTSTGSLDLGLLNQNLKKNYYVYKNSFLSDDGKIGRWKANERLAIFANPSDSLLIGTLNKNQKFYALNSEYHYYQIPYARIEEVYSNDFDDCPNSPFKVGDMVYLLNAEGEGIWNVIHEDKLTYINCSYEPEKASLTRSVYDGCNNVSARIIDETEEFIYWVQIKTLDGKKGWIKNPNCKNVIGTRPNCYNNSSPAW